jgi:Fe-coproporphyrin III synthase
MPARLPVDAVIAVTYRCNGRCVMCNIWCAPAGDEMRPGAYRALPASLRHVNITGGEPFLRQDLPEVIAQVREACPKAAITISTNGLQPQRTREMIERILSLAPEICVAVSMDGIQDTHDRIRGVEGAYGKARETLQLLKEAGVKHLRVAYTATPDNVTHMRKVYQLSQELGCEFTCAIAHCSPHYFKTAEGSFAVSPSELREEVREIGRKELRSLSLKRLARAYFLRGLLAYAEGRGRLLPCTAGLDTIFITPEGDVFPCNAFSMKMGNISEKTVAEIWRSDGAAVVRSRLARCKAGCWMICSARMPMRRHPVRVGAWIAGRLLVGGHM